MVQTTNQMQAPALAQGLAQGLALALALAAALAVALVRSQIDVHRASARANLARRGMPKAARIHRRMESDGSVHSRSRKQSNSGVVADEKVSERRRRQVMGHLGLKLTSSGSPLEYWPPSMLVAALYDVAWNGSPLSATTSHATLVVEASTSESNKRSDPAGPPGCNGGAKCVMRAKGMTAY